MYHTPVKHLLVILVLLAGNSLFAQTGSYSNPTNGRENNPYSKYGIGELSNGNSAVLRGMGNISSAFSDAYEMNTENPASYSFIERTTFELGGMAGSRTISTTDLNYTTGTATLAYFSLGFPINKHAGFALGFKPVSHIYYNMQDTLPKTSIGDVARFYSGEGGLNYAYLGGAWKYKGFSIGANVGYMFGSIHNTTASVPIYNDTFPQNRAYNAEYTSYNQIGGLHGKLGLMYIKKLDSNYTLNFGATLTLSQNLTQRVNAFQISNFNLGDTIINDTTYNAGEQHGKLKLPMSFSVGVILRRNDKWSVGIDYNSTQWSGFNSSPDATLNNGIASQAYKFSVGGEYTPDINNVRSYLSRVTYRLGAYYGSDYISVNGTQLPVYGFTAGTSLPFRRTLSRMHLAFDLGRLGTTKSNLLQETYFRFTMGVSINDRWFVKRRYD